MFYEMEGQWLYNFCRMLLLIYSFAEAAHQGTLMSRLGETVVG